MTKRERKITRTVRERGSVYGSSSPRQESALAAIAVRRTQDLDKKMAWLVHYLRSNSLPRPQGE